MKRSSKRWVVMTNVTIAFLVLLVGVLQYKIAQYNSEIGNLNENITGKVTSSLFINFDFVQERLEIVEHNFFLLHDKPLEARVKEDQILSKRSEIMLNYLTISQIPTDEAKRVMASIIKNSNTSFGDKYNELRMLYDKYKGSLQSFLDKEYQKKRSTQDKLGIASFIQIMAMVALFISTSLVSVLAFKNEESVRDVPKIKGIGQGRKVGP